MFHIAYYKNMDMCINVQNRNGRFNVPPLMSSPRHDELTAHLSDNVSSLTVKQRMAFVTLNQCHIWSVIKSAP